jgi:Putative O-methyltransferase
MPDFSFEKVNYSLRPNKNVERKLIVRLLATLDHTANLGMKSYTYIGLGSMWFVDFILVHRTIGISSLFSIEREESRENRAEFNRPYSCITIIPGETAKVLPTLIQEHPRCVVWLDYDDQLSEYMFEDIETFCRRSQAGSVLLISANANLPAFREEHRTLDNQGAELRRVAGVENVPADAAKRLTKNSYPALINEILLTKMRSFARTAQPDLKFLPLADVSYSDGVPMATCGGILVNAAQESMLDGAKVEPFDLLAAHGHARLAVPQLTHKEKLELDRLMPRGLPPDRVMLPFELKQTEIDAYWKYYLEYPLYSELLF